MRKFYTKTGFLVFIFLALIFKTNGQTTYTWIGANNASWATGTSWSPTRSAPATNDVLQFNDGTTKNITSVPTQTIGRLLVSSNTNITLQTSANRTVTVGNGTGDDIVITVGSSLSIGGSSNLNVILNTNASANISGTLIINTGRTFDLSNSGVMVTVTGSIINSSNTNSGVNGASAVKLFFASGSVYEHALNNGAIPSATWNSNSTCNITGLTGNLPSGLDQAFGHFIWNCAGQSGHMNLEPNGMSVAGDFSILNTNTRRLRISNSNTDRSLSIAGSFIQSGGIISVTDANGDGTLNIAGDFNFSGGSFILKDGNGASALNIDGNFSMTGGTFDQRAGGNPATSTVNVTGSFNLSNGTYDMSSANAIGLINISGNFSHTGGTLTETGNGNGDIVFNGNGVQTFTSGGTASNIVNFTVNSGSILRMASASTVVSGGGSFALLSGGGLCITSTTGITGSGASGNVQVTGSRSFNSGSTYIYEGSAVQVNGNGLPSSVSQLIINNNTGVNLQQTVSVTGSLTFINGILTTTSSNLLIINDNTIVSGACNTSFVSGPVQKIGNDSFTFPIGKNGVYTPISISAPANVTDAFTGEYFLTNPKTLGTSITAPGLVRIGECEYWTLDQTSGTSSVNITLSWNTAGPCVGETYINDLTSLTVAHFNGTSWDQHGSNGGTTGDFLNGTITWNSVSVFSPFTLGSTTAMMNPLPVKFGGIKVYEKQAGVQIEWNTYSENNLDYFEVQRSADRQTFSAIGRLNAKNLNQKSDYNWFDAFPLPADNFYRIKSVGLDRKTEFTVVVKMNFKKTNPGLNVYPNPVLNKQLTFQAPNLEKGEYVFSVTNSSGQLVYKTNLSVNGGAIRNTLNLPNSLKPGMYGLQLINKSIVVNKVFLLQ